MEAPKISAEEEMKPEFLCYYFTFVCFDWNIPGFFFYIKGHSTDFTHEYIHYWFFILRKVHFYVFPLSLSHHISTSVTTTLIILFSNHTIKNNWTPFLKEQIVLKLDFVSIWFQNNSIFYEKNCSENVCRFGHELKIGYWYPFITEFDVIWGPGNQITSTLALSTSCQFHHLTPAAEPFF